ncbi:MAG: PAS domain-containing sensor histidine kinase [Pseudomonadota bacterium]
MRTGITIAIVVLGPVLAILTVLGFGGLDRAADSSFLRLILTADLVYMLVVAGLIGGRIAKLVADRRAKSAGSRLHMRLTGVFSFIALAPTIIVAIFAALTVNFGLEGWFSDRVQSVVSNSMSAAEAYENEHRSNLRADALLLADYLNSNKERFPLISGAELRELLTSGQQQMQRELSEAYVIDGGAELISRGYLSYLFDYEAPSLEQIEAARTTGPVVIEDWINSEFRALIHLPAFVDRYLYVTRSVDGKILELLDETRSTVVLYQQLESDRGRLLFEFALFYLGFALIIIFSAIWGAFWFADRLSRPVGRLAGAAQRVGQGDFDVRVKEEHGDDEIAMLGRVFNRMTQQVKRQRDALVVASTESEERRRLFEAVLSGVTAGVIGLGPDGRIEVVNDAALQLLTLEGEGYTDAHIGDVVPAVGEVFRAMIADRKQVVQDQVRVTTRRREEELLIRIARHQIDEERAGYVVTFDSITDLVSAQRLAAWGDVARRIAHEIKNPLTPIQLAAERMRRKYAPHLEDDRAGFEQYTDVIVRQTNDLRRIVDEFSKFARMPEAEPRDSDVSALIRDMVLLRRDAAPEIGFVEDLPEGPLYLRVDPTLFGQALTNLLKNAVEAVHALPEEADGPREVTVRVVESQEQVTLSIADTGIGLPEGSRSRLFEPYVTHREKGTGLGLPIVKKIVEDHGGTLTLSEAETRGAVARIVLPRAAVTPENSRQSKVTEDA